MRRWMSDDVKLALWKRVINVKEARKSSRDGHEWQMIVNSLV